MEEKIRVIFEGNEELLNIISTHDEISKILGVPNEKCPLIDTEIKLTKEIGRGNFGTVFLITFPGLGAKKYVVKKIIVDADMTTLTKRDWINYKIGWNELLKFQTQQTINQFKDAKPIKKISWKYRS